MIAPSLESDDERAGFDEARAAISASTHALPAETVALEDAGGRILATAYRAREDLIPFARSAMDGYAVRAADLAFAPGREPALPISPATFAGDPSGVLPPGSVVPIATGAPLPAGADAVVPIEHTRVRNGRAMLFARPQPGDHVFPPGDDARSGEAIAYAGQRVTPGRAALLAAAGIAAVLVYRRPRVALVLTGNELVSVNSNPPTGCVRNSNESMLRAHVARDGGEVVFTAVVRDEGGALRRALEAALAQCDLLITTGGASVGERDLVKSSLATLSASFVFRSVALRPAKPSAFATVASKPVLVLPGNPAAAFVGYLTLVRLALRRLAGLHDVVSPLIAASLDGTIHVKQDRHFALFAHVVLRDEGFLATLPANQCSSLVRTSAGANALVIVPPGEKNYERGAMVGVEIFDWETIRVG